ncbi:Protein AKTIP homolog [Geodia barretti]|uniref:Protein AKTIP homolog n=1 Tax=Geodia barretti TaxID=519541 RepID=A0AA35WIB0_GEOBA|nr:Protein AKTIP homolog [Geodia barretti]
MASSSGLAPTSSTSSQEGRKSPLTLNRDELATTYNAFFLEATLTAEYNYLTQHHISGVYVLPSDISSLIWYGLLIIRRGLYQGALFKFKLLIPANYPDGGCPELDFQTGVYHPKIEYDTGELDTKKEFPRWRRDINHLYQLLAYARKIFHQIDTTNPVNIEAGKLYKTDINSYKQKVKESIENCKQATMNPDPSDPHSVKIGEWSIDVMKKARTEIFEPEVCLG